MSDHVADDEKSGAGIAGHRLEPVAPGAGILRGHQVFGRDVRARQYRQRRRKQRSLNQNPKIPHLCVTLGQFCGAGFGCPSLMYLRGDVGQHHLGAFDGPVYADAGTDDDIAANFLHGSRSVEVELETPLPPLLDLSRAINPVENLDQVLTLEFGKYLARRQHPVSPRETRLAPPHLRPHNGVPDLRTRR